MDYRRLGSTGLEVSRIGFGAWAIGADWGDVSEDDAMAALNTALDEGITFFDTADVYGDGRSERLIAQLRSERPAAQFTVATKAGRRINPHVAAGYTAESIGVHRPEPGQPQRRQPRVAAASLPTDRRLLQPRPVRRSR